MLELKNVLEEKISEVLKEWTVDSSRVFLEDTNDLSKGDLTTNIAMQLSKELGKSPREIAEEIVSKLGDMEEIEKVEIAGPGFINFFFSESYLTSLVSDISKRGAKLFNLENKKGKDLVIEYTDPNPFKILHIGHLYTNMVGESFVRLQEALGANVARVNYQGDVGLHVAKTLWGLEKKLESEGMTFEELSKKDLVERVKYLGEAYILGVEYYDDKKDSKAQDEIKRINYYIFSLFSENFTKQDYFSSMEERKIEHMYREGRQWCLDHFETVYERVGARFDHYFFESEVGKKGLEVVLENTDGKGKGVFKSDEGSVIYEGDSKKGLHTRVFVNKEGVPTYEAKDLGLAFAKKEKIDYEESIIITGNEQSSYFEVVLDALSQLEPELANVTKHISHGMVKLPGAEKMASRKGKIITAEWLLNETQSRVREIMKDSGKWHEEDIEKVSDIIGIAAIKYAFLKVSVGKDVIFDFDKSISFDGDTGPYLLYVYARCMSLLDGNESKDIKVGSFENEAETELARVLSRFESVLLTSATEYSPSILCSYLFDLGQSFNRFYQSVRVLDSQRKEELLVLVSATAQLMRYGLDRLGIEAVDHM